MFHLFLPCLSHRPCPLPAFTHNLPHSLYLLPLFLIPLDPFMFSLTVSCLIDCFFFSSDCLVSLVCFSVCCTDGSRTIHVCTFLLVLMFSNKASFQLFVWAPNASRLHDYFAHCLAQTSSPASNFSGLIVLDSGLVSEHSSLLQTHVFTKWLVSLVYMYANRENRNRDLA